MEQIDSEISLREAIRRLEGERIQAETALRGQFHDTCESLKPLNLIKSSFHQAVTGQDLKGGLLNTSVGLTAGYLSKILFQGLTRSPLNKVIGTALMMGITSFVKKNPEGIASFFKTLVKGITGHVSGERAHEARPTGAGEEVPGSK